MVGRWRTMIVKTPSAVPKGNEMSDSPAVTRQSTRRLRFCSERPVTTMSVASANAKSVIKRVKIAKSVIKSVIKSVRYLIE